MSLFGQSSSGASGTGSSSLFSGLNLDTSVGADLSGKRKSVFDASSTTAARSQAGLFGSGSQSATTTTAPSFSFGAPSTTTATTTTTTTAAAPAGTLFSTLASTAPASGGLFGTAKPPSSAPASTGLFPTPAAAANPTSAASMGTSLFGGTNTAPAASTPSLFSNTPTNTTTAQPATTSLFGNTSTSTQPTQTGGLFGNASAQPPTASNLGASMVNQMPSQHPAQVGRGEAAYFSSLLERQKKKARYNNTDRSNNLGLSGMSMDLGDLARKAQELGNKTKPGPSSSAKDSRAHYLLSGSGVNPGQAYREFQNLEPDSIPPKASLQNEFADESAAYLKGMQLKGREAMLRESMDRVYREVDAYIEQTLGIDFDEQKKRIMQHFGLAPDDSKSPSSSQSTSRLAQNKDSTRSIFGRSAVAKSMIGSTNNISLGASFSATPSGALGKNQSLRDLRDKERLFVQKIEELNKARSAEQSYPILKEFEAVENASFGDTPKQVKDAYIALQEITRENATSTGLRERHYAKSYLQSQSTHGDTKWRKQVLQQSRTYLEKSFYKELESIVEKNTRTAQIGGIPTIINKVRAYIRVRAERHDLVPDGAELQQIGDGGDYCWALIFYLLRSGHVHEAAEYVNNDPVFQSTDKRFANYINSYTNNPDHRLSRKLQEMIENEYQHRSKNAPKGSVDPYRMACYKVLGRCDLAQRNLDSIGQGVEDWIWLQFCLARESEASEELTGDIFGLEQICETVSEIGQKHFSKTQTESTTSYGTFFLMQVLAGMFEQAVDYLHAFNPVSAVHIAIALSYCGLLRVADYTVAGNDLLTYSTTQQAQINYVPLVAYYTAAFRIALPVPAVDYLTLICLNSDLQPAQLGAVHTNACHECLRELCLETREFAALLGDIRADGSRVVGAIEQRARLIKLDSHERFLQSITNQAALIADQRGQTADAVLLYHLCDDYDNVVSVLNRALADAVSVELGDIPMSLQPLKPRHTDGSENASQETADNAASASSLSLTQATSSPAQLATNIMNLYNSNAMYYQHISRPNRQTVDVLQRMLAAKAVLETNNPNYSKALEAIHEIGVLPLDANGDISYIRQGATNFSSLPQLIIRSAGIAITWCVRAIGGERERLAREGSWSAYGSADDMNAYRYQLGQMAKDLMVFAGLVKYKLPSRVYDMLTRAGGDIGGY